MKILYVLAAAAALSCNAFAATVSFNSTFPVGAPGVQQVPSGAAGAVNFNISKFDPSLGNLTNVAFSLDGTAVGGYTFTNTNGNGVAETFTFSNLVTIAVSNPFGAGNLVVTIPGLSDITRTVADGATYTTNGRTLTASQTTAANTSNAAVLAGFTGVGTQTLTAVGTQNPIFNATGDNNSSVSSRDYGTLTITYTFTPTTSTVPEPATMGLLGSALVGLGLLKFRTRKS